MPTFASALAVEMAAAMPAIAIKLCPASAGLSTDFHIYRHSQSYHKHALQRRRHQLVIPNG